MWCQISIGHTESWPITLMISRSHCWAPNTHHWSLLIIKCLMYQVYESMSNHLDLIPAVDESLPAPTRWIPDKLAESSAEPWLVARGCLGLTRRHLPMSDRLFWVCPIFKYPDIFVRSEKKDKRLWVAKEHKALWLFSSPTCASPLSLSLTLSKDWQIVVSHFPPEYNATCFFWISCSAVWLWLRQKKVNQLKKRQTSSFLWYFWWI